MQKYIIASELELMHTNAIHYNLIPANISELEFTVNVDGQASILEYWPNCPRVDTERVEVHIPVHLLKKFVFAKTSIILSKK